MGSKDFFKVIQLFISTISAVFSFLYFEKLKLKKIMRKPQKTVKIFKKCFRTLNYA